MREKVQCRSNESWQHRIETQSSKVSGIEFRCSSFGIALFFLKFSPDWSGKLALFYLQLIWCKPKLNCYPFIRIFPLTSGFWVDDLESKCAKTVYICFRSKIIESGFTGENCFVTRWLEMLQRENESFVPFPTRNANLFRALSSK